MLGARVLIIKNNNILLIHRFKSGREYYVLPGGSVEKSETPEIAAVREVKEETNLDVKLKRLLWKYKEEYNFCLGYYFLADSFKGKLHLGGPESLIQNKDNQYLLEWIGFAKLKEILFYPVEIKEKILQQFLKPSLS